MGYMFAEITHKLIGTISFAAGDQGLRCVSFQPLVELKKQSPFQESKPSMKGFEIMHSTLKAIYGYFSGNSDPFDIEIDWDGMSSFQRQVLEITKAIPFGSLKSYGDIARRLKKPGAARSVGRALGSNPMPIIIPCHRVIAADRKLRGYSGGIIRKINLLKLEGHRIENDRVMSESGSFDHS